MKGQGCCKRLSTAVIGLTIAMLSVAILSLSCTNVAAKTHHSKRQVSPANPNWNTKDNNNNWWNLWWQQYINDAVQPTVRPIVAVSFHGKTIALADQLEGADEAPRALADDSWPSQAPASGSMAVRWNRQANEEPASNLGLQMRSSQQPSARNPSARRPEVRRTAQVSQQQQETSDDLSSNGFDSQQQLMLAHQMADYGDESELMNTGELDSNSNDSTSSSSSSSQSQLDEKSSSSSNIDKPNFTDSSSSNIMAPEVRKSPPSTSTPKAQAQPQASTKPAADSSPVIETRRNEIPNQPQMVKLAANQMNGNQQQVMVAIAPKSQTNSNPTGNANSSTTTTTTNPRSSSTVNPVDQVNSFSTSAGTTSGPSVSLRPIQLQTGAKQATQQQASSPEDSQGSTKSQDSLMRTTLGMSVASVDDINRVQSSSPSPSADGQSQTQIQTKPQTQTSTSQKPARGKSLQDSSTRVELENGRPSAVAKSQATNQTSMSKLPQINKTRGESSSTTSTSTTAMSTTTTTTTTSPPEAIETTRPKTTFTPEVDVLRNNKQPAAPTTTKPQQNDQSGSIATDTESMMTPKMDSEKSTPTANNENKDPTPVTMVMSNEQDPASQPAAPVEGEMEDEEGGEEDTDEETSEEPIESSSTPSPSTSPKLAPSNEASSPSPAMVTSTQPTMDTTIDIERLSNEMPARKPSDKLVDSPPVDGGLPKKTEITTGVNDITKSSISSPSMMSSVSVMEQQGETAITMPMDTLMRMVMMNSNQQLQDDKNEPANFVLESDITSPSNSANSEAENTRNANTKSLERDMTSTPEVAKPSTNSMDSQSPSSSTAVASSPSTSGSPDPKDTNNKNTMGSSTTPAAKASTTTTTMTTTTLAPPTTTSSFETTTTTNPNGSSLVSNSTDSLSKINAKSLPGDTISPATTPASKIQKPVRLQPPPSTQAPSSVMLMRPIGGQSTSDKQMSDALDQMAIQAVNMILDPTRTQQASGLGDNSKMEPQIELLNMDMMPIFRRPQQEQQEQQATRANLMKFPDDSMTTSRPSKQPQQPLQQQQVDVAAVEPGMRLRPPNFSIVQGVKGLQQHQQQQPQRPQTQFQQQSMLNKNQVYMIMMAPQQQQQPKQPPQQQRMQPQQPQRGATKTNVAGNSQGLPRSQMTMMQPVEITKRPVESQRQQQPQQMSRTSQVQQMTSSSGPMWLPMTTTPVQMSKSVSMSTSKQVGEQVRANQQPQPTTGRSQGKVVQQTTTPMPASSLASKQQKQQPQQPPAMTTVASNNNNEMRMTQRELAAMRAGKLIVMPSMGEKQASNQTSASSSTSSTTTTTSAPATTTTTTTQSVTTLSPSTSPSTITPEKIPSTGSSDTPSSSKAPAASNTTISMSSPDSSEASRSETQQIQPKAAVEPTTGAMTNKLPTSGKLQTPANKPEASVKSIGKSKTSNNVQNSPFLSAKLRQLGPNNSTSPVSSQNNSNSNHTSDASLSSMMANQEGQIAAAAIRQFAGSNRMSALSKMPKALGRQQAPAAATSGEQVGFRTAVVDTPTFEYGPSIAVRRPDEPLANGQVPNCTLSGKNFCVLTKDYPMNEVRRAVERSFRSVRIMYEELQTVSDQELHKDERANQTENRAASGRFACETQVEMMRPGWAKDEITREWMLVVNTDVFPQRVRTESCSQPNSPCEFIAPLYDSTCQQRYSLHRMIAIDPHDPTRSPQVAVFKFPAGCVCRVHPIRKTTTMAPNTSPLPTTLRRRRRSIA